VSSNTLIKHVLTHVSDFGRRLLLDLANRKDYVSDRRLSLRSSPEAAPATELHQARIQ